MEFTDQELKSYSSELLAGPQKKAIAEANKQAAVDSKDAKYIEDQNNKKFFDAWLTSTYKYHAELVLLNGTLRTDYIGETALHAAALRQAGNIHFPIPPQTIWQKMTPKVDSSNNGTPIGTYDIPGCEVSKITLLEYYVALSLNGFVDGSTVAPLFSPYSLGGNLVVVYGYSYSVGNRVAVGSGANSCLVRITGAGSSDFDETYTSYPCEFLFGSSSASGSSQNYMNGFTDDERKGTSTPYFAGIWTALKHYLMTYSTDVLYVVDAELQLLINNPDTESENKTEIDNKNDLILAIVDWQALPETGLTSRYADINFIPYTDLIHARMITQIPARATSIATLLGNVSQDSEGIISGNGAYFMLFKWIDLRINIAVGTLSQYYGMDLGVKVFDTQITAIDTKTNELLKYLIVLKATEDANDTSIIVLESTTGIELGNEVKIMSDPQPAITASVIFIDALNVELSVVIPSTYLVGDLYRLVKVI